MAIIHITIIGVEIVALSMEIYANWQEIFIIKRWFGCFFNFFYYWLDAYISFQSHQQPVRYRSAASYCVLCLQYIHPQPIGAYPLAIWIFCAWWVVYFYAVVTQYLNSKSVMSESACDAHMQRNTFSAKMHRALNGICLVKLCVF